MCNDNLVIASIYFLGTNHLILSSFKSIYSIPLVLSDFAKCAICRKRTQKWPHSKTKQKSFINIVFYAYFTFRLTIQPHFSNATSSGDLIIDVVRDANENGFPPIVLDINNITVTETHGMQSPHFQFAQFTMAYNNFKLFSFRTHFIILLLFCFLWRCCSLPKFVGHCVAVGNQDIVWRQQCHVHHRSQESRQSQQCHIADSSEIYQPIDRHTARILSCLIWGHRFTEKHVITTQCDCPTF